MSPYQCQADPLLKIIEKGESGQQLYSLSNSSSCTQTLSPVCKSWQKLSTLQALGADIFNSMMKM
jgi:hypothetical protein